MDATGRSGRIIFGYRAGELQAGSHIRKAAAERAWGFVIDTLRNDPKHVLIEETSMDEARGRPNRRVSKLDVYGGPDDAHGREPQSPRHRFSPTKTASFV